MEYAQKNTMTSTTGEAMNALLPILKWTTLAVLVIGAVLTVVVLVYLQQPQFDAPRNHDNLAAFAGSPNYVDGEFRNQVPSPLYTGPRQSRIESLWRFLTADDQSLRPDAPLPVVKTDLRALDPTQDIVVWLGHSSFFVQLGGQRILIDPVFSIDAAPLPWVNRAFDGTSIYHTDDLPAIDHLLITHDHWDHLDHPTITALKPKVRNVIVPLGVGSYFAQWGYPREKLHEADWYTALQATPGFTVHVLPARHFSGRLLERNKTLWAAYALEANGQRLFFSGDTGFGPHFEEITRRIGPGFDLVVTDNGQYNERWAHVHMTPEEAFRAAQILGAKTWLPAHIGKFRLARHTWHEPFDRAAAISAHQSAVQLATPRIGEPLQLNSSGHTFAAWWREADTAVAHHPPAPEPIKTAAHPPPIYSR